MAQERIVNSIAFSTALLLVLIMDPCFPGLTVVNDTSAFRPIKITNMESCALQLAIAKGADDLQRALIKEATALRVIQIQDISALQLAFMDSLGFQLPLQIKQACALPLNHTNARPTYMVIHASSGHLDAHLPTDMVLCTPTKYGIGFYTGGVYTSGPNFSVYREKCQETPLTDLGIPLLTHDTSARDSLTDDTSVLDTRVDDTKMSPPVDWTGLSKPCDVNVLLAFAAKKRAYIEGRSTSEWVKAPSSDAGRRILAKYLAAPLNDESIAVPWVTTPEGKCPQPRAGKDAVFSFTPHPADNEQYLVWIRYFKKTNPYKRNFKETNPYKRNFKETIPNKRN